VPILGRFEASRRIEPTNCTASSVHGGQAGCLSHKTFRDLDQWADENLHKNLSTLYLGSKRPKIKDCADYESPVDMPQTSPTTVNGRTNRPQHRAILSRGSYFSLLSLGSAGSILSIGSTGSLLSIGSAGSILSIGSAGSILSIGSAGSVLSVLSLDSILSVLQFWAIGKGQ
jgi:hypothetical protein